MCEKGSHMEGGSKRRLEKICIMVRFVISGGSTVALFSS
jgi:hypothetical protein